MSPGSRPRDTLPGIAPLLLLLAACGPKDPGPSLSFAAGTTTVDVDRFGEGSLLGTQPVALDGFGEGDVTVTAEGVTLWGADGAPLPARFAAADLPRTVYLRGVEPGVGTVTASVEGATASLSVSVVPPAPLTGAPRSVEPGFGFTDAFAFGQDVHVALDPAAYPELQGVDLDVWLVPHRSTEAWIADPSLTDLTGAVETARFEGLAGQLVWSAAAPTDPGTLGLAFDAVIDVDGDGALSPGDRLDQGSSGDGVRVAADFAEAGPHPVETVNVSGGDWLGQRVYLPTDLTAAAPLVVISHGNGHDYTWYDYLGEHLASWGLVVMAHENETGPGIETASTTTLTNTDWLLQNLGEVGAEGLVDPSRMAWIGHSRGGEGIVRAYARMRLGEYTPAAFAAEDVRALASIAPTVFYEVDVSDPHDVRYHLLAGSSDGDVTGGPDIPQAESFRLLQAARGLRSSTYVYGASHEDFNCCGRDDGQGPDQLGRSDVQRIARAYLLAVVAEAVWEDPFARDLLSHDPLGLPATDLDATVLSTWHTPGARVIDDFQANVDPARASSGAPVSADVTEIFEGALDDADGRLEWTGADPMNGMTQAEGPVDDAAGLVFSYEEPGFFEYELPGHLRDWSGARYFSFAGCQGTRHPLTVELAGPLLLDVTLTDGAGVSVTRSSLSGAAVATPYLRTRLGEGAGWSNAYSTVRIPLVDFTAGGTGLDLTDIAFVRFDVGADGSVGRLGLDDVEIAP